MNDISMLRERLDQIGDEAGELRVDIERARARGRRLLRLRRAATAGASAAMVGVVVAVVAITGKAAPSRPATTVPEAPVVAMPRPAQIAATASFGWLPARFAADSFVADSQDRPYFEIDAGTSAGSGPVIILTDYGRGPQPALPDLPGGVPASPIPTAPVSGHAAYWITAPTVRPDAQLSFELRWEYGPDRWADLQASGLPATSAADVTSTAYRIARTARLGEHVLLTMPFGVTGIPAGLQARRIVLNSGAQGSALIYFVGSNLAPSDSIQLSVSPTGLTSHHPGSLASGQFARRFARHRGAPSPASEGVTTNTVIDGHPAYDSQLTGQAGGAILWVFGVHGLDVEINAGASALAALPRSHDLIWLFSHMSIVNNSRSTG
jgi:hypothetical protein